MTKKSQGILILAIVFELGNCQLNYPSVRRDEAIVEDYHGIQVGDPYRWLEDLDSPETNSFIQDQRAISNTFLDAIQDRKEIHEKLSEFVNYPKFSAPITKGGFYFHFYNSGLQGHDVLYKQGSLDGELEVLVDPNSLSEDGSVSLGFYYAFSPNASKFVYSLSQKGSDWLTGHFKDVETGEILPDVLKNIQWPEFSFSSDSSGVFYSGYSLEEDGEEVSTNPQIYFHKIGEDQSQDVLIAQNSEHPEWFLFAEVSKDGDYLIVKPQPDFKSNSVSIASLNGSILTSGLLPVFSALDEQARFIYVTNDGDEFVFLTDKDAPNFQLIRLKIDTKTQEIGEIRVLVAEHEKNILKWVSPFNQDKLVLCYFEDVKHKLEVRRGADGALLHQIEIAEGVISEYSIFKENNEFFFKFENLLTPGIIYRCIFEDVLTCQIYKEVALRTTKITQKTELSDFTQKQIFYESKDGTQIPMFIAHKKNISMDGACPALLFGYGGFNVDTLPTFSPFNFAFMDHFDGVFAIANIRGGAEYGEKWHEGGTVLKKQNSFDDFQAGAEYLIREGFTSPSNLAIQGSSNGGLLVAASINQRPDLFGIALPDVGLMDMLRFQKSSIGFAWCSEYGCSENETHFHNLYTYSPLHNIKMPTNSSIQYPAVLVSTADHDDRVPPSHSFKYISQLQYILGKETQQTNPMIIRITENAGHNGEATSIIQRIEDYADSFAFISEKLRKDKKEDVSSANSQVLPKSILYFCSFFILFATSIPNLRS